LNENSTQPPTQTVGGQARAFEALADIARTFPTLPATFSRVFMDGEDVCLQASTTDAFEAWRVALSVPPGDVQLKEYNGAHWLRAQGVWAGVPIDLTSHSVLIPQESASESVPASGLPVAWHAAGAA
jgi:hypothetical protein